MTTIAILVALIVVGWILALTAKLSSREGDQAVDTCALCRSTVPSNDLKFMGKHVGSVCRACVEDSFWCTGWGYRIRNRERYFDHTFTFCSKCIEKWRDTKRLLFHDRPACDICESKYGLRVFLAPNCQALLATSQDILMLCPAHYQAVFSHSGKKGEFLKGLKAGVDHRTLLDNRLFDSVLIEASDQFEDQIRDLASRTLGRKRIEVEQELGPPDDVNINSSGTRFMYYECSSVLLTVEAKGEKVINLSVPVADAKGTKYRGYTEHITFSQVGVGDMPFIVDKILGEEHVTKYGAVWKYPKRGGRTESGCHFDFYVEFELGLDDRYDEFLPSYATGFEFRLSEPNHVDDSKQLGKRYILLKTLLPQIYNELSEGLGRKGYDQVLDGLKSVRVAAYDDDADDSNPPTHIAVLTLYVDGMGQRGIGVECPLSLDDELFFELKIQTKAGRAFICTFQEDGSFFTIDIEGGSDLEDAFIHVQQHIEPL